MKLSPRLNAISQLVNKSYDIIWDTCCDHGLLGMSLLEKHPNSAVHFVDIEAPIINKLETKLETHFSNFNWRCYIDSVVNLPINQFNGSQLIVIAGVGGDLATEFVTSLVKLYPNIPLEFIICPVHHTYTLRKSLISLDLKLVSETLVTDNKRFYEVIHIASAPIATKEISAIGEALWTSNCQAEKDKKLRYLKRLISHYQKASNSRKELLAPLSAYQDKYQKLLSN